MKVFRIIKRPDGAILVSYPTAKTLPKAHTQALEISRSNALVANKPEIASVIFWHRKVARSGFQQATADGKYVCY